MHIAKRRFAGEDYQYLHHVNKISDVRKQTETSVQRHLLDYTFLLDNFEAVNGKDLKTLLLSSPSKSVRTWSYPNILPTWIH